ncbi:UNVERIFIED_CONTAM: hypothetical protein FKN15_055517 [Acipenser sinensis]
MASRGSARPNGLGQTKICQFKLVLLGDMAVGKSSLVLRFVKGQFDEFQETTIGAAFLAQSVCLDDTTVKFEIWDTAGQERYHSLAPMYYRGAQAAIVVFDITKPETFERAKAWVKELQRQASPNIVIALAGNKSDLAERRMVEYEEAQTYAEDTGLLFMETSAKTAMNVNELFLAIGWIRSQKTYSELNLLHPYSRHNISIASVKINRKYVQNRVSANQARRDHIPKSSEFPSSDPAQIWRSGPKCYKIAP